MVEQSGSPQAREAVALAALFSTARTRQQADFVRSPRTPRFVLESATSMGVHMGMPEQDVQASLASMALWQLYLPAALGARPWHFDAVRDHLPLSYGRVRAALAPLESHRQLVSTVFHMAAFPLVCVMVGAAWRSLHEGPLHLLVAQRNLALFRGDSAQWADAGVEMLGTDPAGLRRLLAGLKDGSVTRLLILADGPQPPGAPGARALDGISQALAIRTSLLAKIHALGITVVPFAHEWDADRLHVSPCAPIDPASLSTAQMMDTIAHHLETLLRRRPEQWQNWTAARIRT